MKTKDNNLSLLIKYIRQLLDIIFVFDAFLMIAVLPFYYEEGYRHIGTDKSAFFRTWSLRLGMLVFPLFLLFLSLKLLQLILNMRQYQNSALLSRPPQNRNRILSRFRLLRKKGTIIDLFAFVYGFSVILSYCLSDYRETALWGSPGWFMGLLPQLIFLTLYFGISRLELRLKRIKLTQILFYLFFPVSAIVFGFGILDRYEMRLLAMEYANPSFISTIGNMNWFCGYMVPVFFSAVGLFWCSSKRQFPLIAYLFLGFATLLVQGSSSGIWALCVILFVLIELTLATNSQAKPMAQLLLLLSLAACLHRVVNIAFPEQLNISDAFLLLLTRTPLAFGLLVCSAFLLWIGHFKKDFSANHLRKAGVLLLILAGITCVSTGLLIVLNIFIPGSIGFLSAKSFFTFNDNWGSLRGATWSISWQCYREQSLLHKIFGIGPDCLWEGISHGSSSLREHVPVFLKTADSATVIMNG